MKDGKTDQYRKIAKFLRYFTLKISSSAGSGHPTSSLSAADLMAVFLNDVFRYDFKNPQNPGNDRLVFSKGHATPLYYSMFAACGAIKIKDLDGYRKFDSILEGHPTFRFPYAEAATGSLGQGLSVGVGLALAIRSLTGPAVKVSQSTLQNRPRQARTQDREASFGILLPRHPSKDYPRVYVLMGDGEMAEGSTWEAINLASYYKLDNLVAILDMNRLGQSQETMLGWDTKIYEKRLQAFGWETIVIDGHNYGEIEEGFRKAINDRDIWKVSEGLLPGGESRKPFAIIAKTIKGKGISFLENKEGWHGKPVPPDQLERALVELGDVDLDLKVDIPKPERREISNFKFQISNKIQNPKSKVPKLDYKLGEQIATRKAYGTALAKLGEAYPNVVSLDAEVKNSTYSEIFKEKFPDRFFEMFIAEQNMVGAAVGFSRLGYIPFVSTFAAFFTRAFDQIRMAAISNANIKFCGSHAGVSIGEDGPSQMGLEDLSMFRGVYGSVVLYPSDAVSTGKIVEEMVKHKGICYLRTSRPTTSVIYGNDEKFSIGGCKVHKLPKSPRLLKLLKKRILIVAAGVTLFEALKAQEELANEGIEVVVVDCYSIKPIDKVTLTKLVDNNSIVITVEDHWFEGGLGDAVLNIFARDTKVKVHKLAVTKMPRSGKPQELLDFEGISASAIIRKIKSAI